MFPSSGMIAKFIDYTQTKLLISHKVGGNIQTVRMSKNMTQIEVVEQLQLMGSMMSRSTLANIEAGRRNIKASDLKALQVLFDVEYNEFFKD